MHNHHVRTMPNRPRTVARWAALAFFTTACGAHAAGPGHAHTHGRIALDAAVDARTITVQMEAPLESFVGFERAPRTDAERGQVADMVAKLKAGQWLKPDPAGACTLGEVTLEAPVLGLGTPPKEGQKGKDDDAHADIDVDVRLDCPQAAQARFIDVDLFSAFPRVRTVAVQLAAPQGQFKRTLKPGATRVSWGK